MVIAERIAIRFFVVDSNGVVPLNEMSKQEYAARTIRPKIQRLLPVYLKMMAEESLERESTRLRVDWQEKELIATGLKEIVRACDINHAINPSTFFKSGYLAGHRGPLETFVGTLLPNYAADRNDPSIAGTSNLSPYLHFGMLSPLEVALAAKQARKDKASTDAFLEELIVRRELSYNFTKFSREYESLAALPQWVQENLARHFQEPREYRYSLEEFETSQTHDPVWNACQHELRTVGKIHGYMRMNWGKKILSGVPPMPRHWKS